MPTISRCSAWELKTKTLTFGDCPAIMGILNVTPDSFSDGGKFFSPQLAIDQALRMEDAGADIIDVGGESTRPYSTPVTEAEECARITPVIEAIANRVEIPISIDTSKKSVALAAIERGAEIINDVTGLEGDPEMLSLAVQTQVGVCAMHMQGTPQTMQDNPQYGDVVAEITDYLRQRDRVLLDAGIKPEKICLDPGIGFGKTHDHNLELMRHCDAFLNLNRPILVGHSRKGFIAKLIGDKSANRMAGSLAFSLFLASKGMQILRVHDVLETKQALDCWSAVA